MTKTEALEYFGNSAVELAKAIGLTRQAVESWSDTVPRSRRESVRLAMKEKAERLKLEAKKLERHAKAMEGKQ